MKRACAAKLQATLDASRLQTSTGERLPRSSKNADGRFVIDPALFPDYVDYVLGPDSGMSVIYKWRKGMKGQKAPLPPPAELEALLPVHTPDRAALARPPADRVQATWLGHASVLLDQAQATRIATVPG